MDVLICDDEPDIQLLLELALTSMGHQTRTVGSAAEAEAAIAERRPDVLLLDVMMPEMDGPTLVRTLRQSDLLHPPRTMLVSAITRNDLARLAEELDVDYLPKPCGFDEIAAAMDTLAA